MCINFWACIFRVYIAPIASKHLLVSAFALFYDLLQLWREEKLNQACSWPYSSRPMTRPAYKDQPRPRFVTTAIQIILKMHFFVTFRGVVLS